MYISRMDTWVYECLHMIWRSDHSIKGGGRGWKGKRRGESGGGTRRREGGGGKWKEEGGGGKRRGDARVSLHWYY